eukprot:1284609-Karenia_brevis.AAC.1
MQKEHIDSNLPRLDSPPHDFYHFNNQLDVDFPAALGINVNFRLQDPALLAWMCSLTAHDARTAYRLLDGANEPPEAPEQPAWVASGSQEEINVYTDG